MQTATDGKILMVLTFEADSVSFMSVAVYCGEMPGLKWAQYSVVGFYWIVIPLSNVPNVIYTRSVSV